MNGCVRRARQKQLQLVAFASRAMRAHASRCAQFELLLLLQSRRRRRRCDCKISLNRDYQLSFARTLERRTLQTGGKLRSKRRAASLCAPPLAASATATATATDTRTTKRCCRRSRQNELAQKFNFSSPIFSRVCSFRLHLPPSLPPPPTTRHANTNARAD